MKQQYDMASNDLNDPKEKKIVNEQEQNKPVNAGDQPFEEESSLTENQRKEKNETPVANEDEITNKDDNDILNKDPGILPE